MRRIVWVAVALVYVGAAGVATQQPAPATDLTWVMPDKVERELPPDPAPKTAPGSTKKYTQAQIDDLLNPPDWYPDQHPTPPQIVVKGHGGAMACGACHLMSGLGHPESSDLTGLSAPYIVQQMIDFKNGSRKDPTGKRMNGIAMEATEMEVREAAEYFAALPRKPFHYFGPRRPGARADARSELRLHQLRAARQHRSRQGDRRDGRRPDDAVHVVPRSRPEGRRRGATPVGHAPGLHGAAADVVQGRHPRGSGRAPDEAMGGHAQRRRHHRGLRVFGDGGPLN
jgi:cytochrome c553